MTHVTGFATLFGVHAAKGEGWEALTALLVPGFFLLGAMLAGFLVTVREEEKRRPHYDWVMALAGLCVLGPPLLAQAGYLGALETRFHLSLSQNAVIMALLCLSSGMQNAALSAASHRSVRITHLTGLTTDLGLGLARLLSLPGKRRGAENKLAAVRLGTLCSFLVGSVAGAAAALRVGFASFLVPGVICLYAAVRGNLEAAQESK